MHLRVFKFYVCNRPWSFKCPLSFTFVTVHGPSFLAFHLEAHPFCLFLQRGPLIQPSSLFPSLSPNCFISHQMPTQLHKLVSKLSNHTNNQNHNQIKVTSLNWSNKLLVIFILFIFIFYSSIWYETKVLSDNFDDLVHSPSVRDLSCIDHCNHSQTCWSRVGAAFQQTSFKHIGARLSGKKVEHYGHTYPTPYGVQTNGESLGGLGTMLGYVFFFLIQKYARQNLCLKKSTTLSMQLSLITLVTK
jgi:hypothetical protein